jgi:hypothetical protein
LSLSSFLLISKERVRLILNKQVLARSKLGNKNLKSLFLTQLIANDRTDERCVLVVAIHLSNSKHQRVQKKVQGLIPDHSASKLIA